MALVVGLGDLATRIVRGLIVRGRVPLQLDEMIVPVATTINLTDPLFSQNPVGFAGMQFNTGGVGLVPQTSICGSGVQGVITIVDAIQITSNEAAFDIWSVALQRGAAAAGVRNGVTLNLQTPTTQTPLTTTLATTTGSIAGSIFLNFNLPANGVTPIIPIGAVLYANDRLNVASTTQGAAVSFWLNFWGREFRGQ